MIDQFLPYIVGLIAVIAGLFGYGRVQRSKGRRDVEAEITKNTLDSIRRANENREEVSRMDDDTRLAEFDRLWIARRKKDRR